MKAPKQMVDVVKSLPKSKRKSAAALAEKTYAEFLCVLKSHGDFSEVEQSEMAADAAAAEVKFVFG